MLAFRTQQLPRETYAAFRGARQQLRLTCTATATAGGVMAACTASGSVAARLPGTQRAALQS
jgi:hypothetical protein